MAETKYTMIGMSGAGKTCYLTAMYMKMATGFDGFTLVTDDHTRTRLERDILNLREPIGETRFPVATNETTTRSYEFRLSYETKKIISFEMLDYAGGSLRTRENTYADVKQSIADSTALYIFIDGKSLCTEDREERKENVNFDCALTVAPLIQDFADTHNNSLPPIVFVVTKADLCKKYASGKEITAIIRDLFSIAFSEGTYSYICAVSLGDTISDDGYRGKLNPVNIHIPIFIGSYHEYYNRCVILKNNIENKDRKLEQEKQTANNKAYKEMNKLKIFRDSSYIERYRNIAKDVETEMKSYQDILSNTKKIYYIPINEINCRFFVAMNQVMWYSVFI
ncbi:MAG: hypothetical protein K2L07_11570, partial [Lachnospiraceae bacterium]|nr:hypothetical protein [Lachnospiraceae bacterium]